MEKKRNSTLAILSYSVLSLPFLSHLVPKSSRRARGLATPTKNGRPYSLHSLPVPPYSFFFSFCMWSATCSDRDKLHYTTPHCTRLNCTRPSYFFRLFLLLLFHTFVEVCFASLHIFFMFRRQFSGAVMIESKKERRVSFVPFQNVVVFCPWICRTRTIVVDSILF